MKRICLLCSVIVLLIASPVLGRQDEPKASPLLTMLALVPDNLTETGGLPSVSYADFEALYTAEGVADQRTEDFDTLINTTPMASIIGRLAPGAPQELNYLAYADKMPDVVGFGWISDVNRSLEYGTLPHTGLILQGTFDPDAIGKALQARGFALRDVEGVPVWYRFEDATLNVEALEPADPFGGPLGTAARIAILPGGYLANSRFWDMTEAVIATSQGSQPSLADNANYRTLAEAVTAPEGLLLQALFFNPADIGASTERPDGYGDLKPYDLAVLADRQEGQDQVHLIGLVYADADQAQAAADEVANRVKTFSLPWYPDRIPVEYYNAAVTASVYESADTGKAVALVEVRYPLPEDRTDPETGNFMPGGPIFRMWYDAIMQRGFPVLLFQ